MKRAILFLVLTAGLAGGALWLVEHHPSAPLVTSPDGRKILYYQSPMHPWITSDKPGKCPICGMNLVPVYENGESTNTGFGLKLNADSVNVANVQTATVERRQLVHSLPVAGAIEMNGHPTWFVFNAYERDFVWLDVGQPVEVTIPALPGKIYRARITHIDTRFLDPDRNDQTHGIQVRATLSENLVHVAGVKLWRPFDGFYAEGRVLVSAPDVLTVPRNAVLQSGSQPAVYVDEGNGYYEQRKVKLGRIGDAFVEVLDGLKEGDKIVTSGGLLIDAEAQISQSSDH
ncbi:MAG: heavy metal-binding domain-containing protein [Verrucomicrobiota bacterium]|jgi:multidrug efflux pump subunit AcrA (membrane-fusion protein)